MRNLPHFIIEEIFSYLTVDDHSELLTANKHIFQTILHFVVKNLRLSYPMPSSFYNNFLPKIGSQVCKLELGFFHKKYLNFLPAVSKISVLEDYHVSVEENIEEILSKYPKLTELNLSQMMLQSDIAPTILSLTKLVVLRLPDFYSEPIQAHSFLESLTTPTLRVLSLELSVFNFEIVAAIAKNLPNLLFLSITSDEASGDREKMLDVKFHRLTSFELMITCPDSLRDSITFQPDNFPSLTALSLSPLAAFKTLTGRRFPLIHDMLLYSLDKQLVSRLGTQFVGLISLTLVCDKISPGLVNEALRGATNLQRIQLHRVNVQEAFKDLPFKEYKVHSFSLISSCPVQSGFFSWMSKCFPLLFRLSIDFDHLSDIPMDAVPFDHQRLYNSLVMFQAGGRFPSFWIHEIIRCSPKLNILGLDSELFSRHCKRLSAKYSSLSTFVTSAFDHEETSDSDSDFDSDSDLDQDLALPFIGDSGSEADSNSDLE